AIAIRRETATAALRRRDSVEGQQRTRHCGRWPPNLFQHRLELREASRKRRWRSLLGKRITGPPEIPNLLLRRDVRKIAQIRGHHNRTDHLHDVRMLSAGSILLRPTITIRLGLLFCAVSLSEQRHGDAEDAKHRGSQNAEIKKGGLRSGFLFHRWSWFFPAK